MGKEQHPNSLSLLVLYFLIWNLPLGTITYSRNKYQLSNQIFLFPQTKRSNNKVFSSVSSQDLILFVVVELKWKCAHPYVDIRACVWKEVLPRLLLNKVINTVPINNNNYSDNVELNTRAMTIFPFHSVHCPGHRRDVQGTTAFFCYCTLRYHII